MIILSMTETTSRGSFIHNQTKHVTLKMADGCREEASAQKNQNWHYYETKCLVEIWANEEIQLWQLLTMCRK